WTVFNGMDKQGSFVPAERLRKQLYRPDVVKLVLAKGSVAEALKEANRVLKEPVKEGVADVEKLLPPKVSLTVVSTKALPTVEVKARAEAGTATQPVTALRLLLDGRPLPGGAAFQRLKQSQARVESEVWKITLPAGKHQLTALARSEDASAVSELI